MSFCIHAGYLRLRTHTQSMLTLIAFLEQMWLRELAWVIRTLTVLLGRYFKCISITYVRNSVRKAGIRVYTGCLRKNGAVSKVNKKLISHLTRTQRTPSAAATVQVSHALPAVRFSCLMRGRGASFQAGVAAGKGFLCDPFWGVQICDYSAAWVSCTV